MNHRHQATISFFIIFFLLLQTIPAISAAPDHHAQLIQNEITNGGYAVSSNGQILEEFNSNHLLIPASILKIVTSLSALHILGEEYRFTTSFFLDYDNNLIIQGHGDPFLISEEVKLIIGQLKKQGLQLVNNIILDDSAFDLTAPADGASNSANPYDVNNGALGVNFNTLPITVTDQGVFSAEPQTPLLPIMDKAGRELQPGTYRINVDSLANNSSMPGRLLYAGELFQHFLVLEGITVNGGIRVGTADHNLKPFMVHSSTRNLNNLLENCLHYSNNYIANQLFLHCGQKQYGGAATWDKARSAIKEFLSTVPGLNPGKIIIVEGSGLSGKNRITPQAMLVILDAFQPYSYLLTPKNSTLLKSGTLKNVYSYAGYLNHPDKQRPFVIILNQQTNTRDNILNLLTPLKTIKLER